MNNCLVTKLKGVVDNDNLNVLGCVDLSFNVSNDSEGITMFDVAQEVTILNGTFVDGSTTKTVGPGEFRINTNTVILNDGENVAKIRIPKYYLSDLGNLVMDEFDFNEVFKYAYSNDIGFFISTRVKNVYNMQDFVERLGKRLLLNSDINIVDGLDVTNLGLSGGLTACRFEDAKGITGTLDNLGYSPITIITVPANSTNTMLTIENFVRNSVNPTKGNRPTGQFTCRSLHILANYKGGQISPSQDNNYTVSWQPSETGKTLINVNGDEEIIDNE